MTWDQMLTLHSRLFNRRAKAFRSFINGTTRLAALAHPATGGNETLCGNWGNDESKRIWSRGWKRWRAYSARVDALSRSAWDQARKAA